MPRRFNDFVKQCAVCAASSRHCFYGAVVCDPCRTFFRRQVINPKVCSLTSYKFENDTPFATGIPL